MIDLTTKYDETRQKVEKSVSEIYNMLNDFANVLDDNTIASDDMDNDTINIVLDLSKFNENNINLDTKDGILTVSAERHSKIKGTGERKHSSFLYQTNVHGYDSSKIEKTFEGGKLTVKIPKAVK